MEELDREHADLLLAEKRLKKTLDRAVASRDEIARRMHELCSRPGDLGVTDGRITSYPALEFKSGVDCGEFVRAIDHANELSSEMEEIRSKLARFA